MSFPGDFLSRGGDIMVVAAELRVALTERLGFIASKDGYAEADFDQTLADETGFANISVGLKYAVINRPADETILTIGLEYEPPTGNLETSNISLQGKGDGLLDLLLTGARAVGSWGFQGSLGLNMAIDDAHDSSQFHYSGHVDYQLTQRLFPLIEVNGFTTVDNGKRTPGVNFEGLDVLNFGSTQSGTVVTAAIGARYHLNDYLIVGAGYETPVTDREDIIDWRAYVDLVIHF